MSSSSSSSSKKHVYVAIPIDAMLREHRPLTDSSSVPTRTSSSSSWHQHQHDGSPSCESRSPGGAFRPLAYLAVGAALGVLFSVVGFYIQESFQFASIFWYSLAWSCLTSVASYALFYGWNAWHRTSSSTTSSSSAAPSARTASASVKSEYHFALGVFLGFCLACIVTDVLLRMPLRSILLTFAIAVAWAAVMAYCGSLEDEIENDVEDDSDNDCVVVRPTAAAAAGRIRGERKGTMLPLLIV